MKPTEGADGAAEKSYPSTLYSDDISHIARNPILVKDGEVGDLDARIDPKPRAYSASINQDDEKSEFPEPQEIMEAPSPSLPLVREILFIAIVCLAQLTTQISFGQVLFILPIIGESFSLKDESDLSWLVAGYSLTVGTFILVSGRFGDVFGYKRMLLVGYSWFALWTMVSRSSDLMYT
jgi:hypothetical protein